MPRLVRLVPAREGLTFPMPNGLDFPSEGVDFDADDLFWQRRLLDGDVVELTTEPEARPSGDAPARKK